MKIETCELFIPVSSDSFDDPLVIHKRNPVIETPILVIFVHGLGGRRYATWGKFPSFLFKDIPQADIGLYCYRTLFSRLRLTASIELDEEALVLADTLRDCVGYTSIILIGHSMGGLLCKAAIKELIDRGDQATLGRLKGLFLMATPQAGSLRMPRFLARFSRDLRALKPHGVLVERIHRTFVDRISMDGSIANKYMLPVWAILASEDLWVSKLSAGLNIPSTHTKIVRGSHTLVVKPGKQEDDVYQWVLTRIKQIIQRGPENNGPVGFPYGLGERYASLDIPHFSAPYIVHKDKWKALAGKVVNEKYLLKACIGFGGTGAAYRARDVSVGREVCVKLFYSVNQELVELLSRATTRAIRGLASLSCDNLLSIIDYGVLDAKSGGASLFVVSNFINGRTLFEWCETLRKKREDQGSNSGQYMVDVSEEQLSLSKKLKLARQIASALRTAHDAKYIGTSGVEERGVFHGDITPSNILVDQDNNPVLIDFMMPDIQKLIFDERWFEIEYRDRRWKSSNGIYSFQPYLTEAYGTPGFMPPEQAAEGIVTAVSDIYTLGLTYAFLFFYDLFDGFKYNNPPFLVEWQSGRRIQHSNVARGFDGDLIRKYTSIQDMLLRMIKIQPQDRFQSMEEIEKLLLVVH